MGGGHAMQYIYITLEMHTWTLLWILLINVASIIFNKKSHNSLRFDMKITRFLPIPQSQCSPAPLENHVQLRAILFGYVPHTS